jgi:hypothetical protein
MFRVRWKVIPVTLEKSDLVVRLEDWQEIFWETNVSVPLHDANLKIKEAFIVQQEKCKACNQVSPYNNPSSIFEIFLLQFVQTTLTNVVCFIFT